MSHDLICDWLKLPAGDWPPDHYTLLGLQPGEADTERIEHQVHERLEIVRRYQLTHPEQATEAMNRLARAFVCLTDPVAKKAYDTGLLGEPPPAPEEAVGPADAGDEPEAPVELFAPPAPAENRPTAQTDIPVAVARAEPLLTPVPTLPVEPVAVVTSPVEIVPPQPAPRPPEVVEPAVEAARSMPARRGLGTRRALYRRLARTRQLARAWEQGGKYLAWPRRQITRPAEAGELIATLGEIRTLARGFPPLLDQAGQGYLVLALARQHAIVPTFQTLLGSQREALARDWWAGRTLLQTHREFLRQELRVLRKKSIVARWVRAARSFLSEHPGGVLLLLALLALNLALWRNILAPEDWSFPWFTTPTTTAREGPAP